MTIASPTWAGAAGFLTALLAATAVWYAVSPFVTYLRLQQFPGPRLASFSYAWVVLAMRSGQMHQILGALQRRYGPVARVGPDELLVSDPETLLRINSVRSSYSRGGWYSSLRFDPSGHSVLSEPDTARHDARKAQLAGGYAGRGRIDLEAAVDSQVAVLANLLESRYAAPGKVADFGRIARYFTVDVTTMVGMGEPWGDLPTETDVFHFLGTSDSLVPFLHTISMAPLLRSFFSSSFFLTLAGPKTTDKMGLGQFLGVAKKEVEKRFSEGPKTEREHDDMLDDWIKQGLTPEECRREIALLVPAGYETTTTAIRGTMLYILTTPLVYRKLKDEIADGIRSGRISSPITNKEAKDLPYLQAVINEGIRMMPPSLTGFAKRVPAGGDTICGTFVPEGTEVLANLYGMMHNRDVFGDDVDVFRPERFLDGDSANTAQLLRTVDFIFGHGRWMCPGKALAWMELNKVFVELLRRFDFQVVNPEKPWRSRSFSSFQITDFWIRVMDGKLD